MRILTAYVQAQPSQKKKLIDTQAFSLVGVLVGVAMVVGILALFFKAWQTRNRQKAYDLRRQQSEDEMRRRLEAVAGDVGGKLVEGPALETAEGRLILMATKAPEVTAVDLTKFTAPTKTSVLLSLVQTQDAGRSVQLKDLKPVTLDDPALAKAYAVQASDEAAAKKLVTAELVEKLQAVDRAVRGRARLQISHGGVTVLVPRGLNRPEELKAFYEGCVALAGWLRPRLEPPKS